VVPSPQPRDAAAVTEVKLNRLIQAFGGTRVLQGLDLKIGLGVTGLLGPEGSGKTTVMRTLATVIRPSDGTLSIQGHDPADEEQRRSLRRQLGYLPQALGYYPGFTVRAFVEYFALLKEVPNKEVDSAVAQAIRRVGLHEHAGSKLGSLSEGMLRCAALAQAIVNRPQLLLLDDPMSCLDPEQRATVLDLIRDFGDHGIVVFATRAVEEVGEVCEVVVTLTDGTITFCGSVGELAKIGESSDRLENSALERGYRAVLAEGKS